MRADNQIDAVTGTHGVPDFQKFDGRTEFGIAVSAQRQHFLAELVGVDVVPEKRGDVLSSMRAWKWNETETRNPSCTFERCTSQDELAHLPVGSQEVKCKRNHAAVAKLCGPPIRREGAEGNFLQDLDDLREAQTWRTSRRNALYAPAVVSQARVL